MVPSVLLEQPGKAAAAAAAAACGYADRTLLHVAGASMRLTPNSDRSAPAPISQQGLTSLPSSVLVACSAHICTALLLLLLL
jgi:hypothetical protein